MAAYCRTCGRPMEGRSDICEACKENIRAEAMGRQRKIAKQTSKEAGKAGVRDKKEVKDKKSPPSSHNAEEEKKPRHFKSMAEYMEYLKRKD